MKFRSPIVPILLLAGCGLLAVAGASRGMPLDAPTPAPSPSATPFPLRPPVNVPTAPPSTGPTPPPLTDVEKKSEARGRIVYQRYCVSCHGEHGDGRGEAAAWINPKPRDFRQGTFKWRSTPSGALPLTSDLERTITNGVHGTNMPTWYAIGKRNRRDVLQYIKTFSPRWRTDPMPSPIVIPPEPKYDEASVKRGRAIYDKVQCGQCHGREAHGDGESAFDLKDEWGNPIVPYDLTLGHIKCGNEGADIYRVFITGLNGTPMPSFVDSIKPNEAWDLVHYIQSLSPDYPKNR